MSIYGGFMNSQNEAQFVQSTLSCIDHVLIKAMALQILGEDTVFELMNMTIDELELQVNKDIDEQVTDASCLFAKLLGNIDLKELANERLILLNKMRPKKE